MARDRTPRDAFGRPVPSPSTDAATPAPPATVEEALRAPSPTTPEPVRGPATTAPLPGGPVAGRARPWEEHATTASASAAVNPQATVALVLGALGLVVVPVLLSIAAIVVAGRADRVADAHPGAPGRGSARAGRILGYFGLAFWVLLPLLFVLVFALSAST